MSACSVGKLPELCLREFDRTNKYFGAREVEEVSRITSGDKAMAGQSGELCQTRDPLRPSATCMT
jgi:hypothetical protein